MGWNRVKKKIPLSGEFFLMPHNREVCVVDHNKRPIMTVGLPFVSDESGASPTVNQQQLPEVSKTVVGESHRGYYGVGTVVEKTFVGQGRTVTQTIELCSHSLNIQCDIDYTSSKNVQLSGYTISIEQSCDLMIFGENAGHYGELYNGGTHQLRTRNDPSTATIYDENNVLRYDLTYLTGWEPVVKNWQTKGAGTSKASNVTIPIGTPKIELLTQPNGMEAALMFSNHADQSNVARVSAVMWGSDDAGHANYGIKGFVSRGIKTSWSVFVVGSGVHEGIDAPAFKAIIDAMHTDGQAICPHTTVPTGFTRAVAEAHLPLLAGYAPTDWIDHGLTPEYHPATIKVYGWDSANENYIMDLLESYGYIYCWGRDMSGWENRGLNQVYRNQIGLPHSVCFQNANKAQPSQGPMWQYETVIISNSPILTESDLDALISQRGASILHTYIAMPSEENKSWKMDGSTHVIAEQFDAGLEHLQNRIALGKVWNPTVDVFCEYFRKLLNIGVQVDGNRRYKITNTNDASLNCSFFVPAKNTAVAGFSKKETKDGTIFWGNVSVGETQIILN